MKLLSLLSQYRRWLITWHSMPVGEWIRGAVYFREGNYPRARSSYARGLQRHPDHPASICARLDLAFCLMKAGELDAAEIELKLVSMTHPRVREAHLRLARLQLWRGRGADACWSLRRAFRHDLLDAELAALFIFGALDSGENETLLEEARTHAQAVLDAGGVTVPLEVAIALLENGATTDPLRAKLLVDESNPEYPPEALALRSEQALRAGNEVEARRLGRRALVKSPESPRAMGLMAKSYLISGPFYNSQFAVQLATSACQRCDWGSQRELHTLAEALYHSGDTASALLVAERAEKAGERSLTRYTDREVLKELIESLREESGVAGAIN